MGLNYGRFGDAKSRNHSYLLGVVSAIILFGGIIQIPDHIMDRIPNSLIPTIRLRSILFRSAEFHPIKFS